MVANDSLNDHSPLNHNLSLSHQPPDENFMNPEESNHPNEETDDQLGENPINLSDAMVPEENVSTEVWKDFMVPLLNKKSSIE